MKMIDLHTHSVYSDGASTPLQLVTHAKELGISAISLTDHDSISGVKETVELGKKLGVEVIPGIELSVISPKELHILGYFIDIDNDELNEALVRVRESRLKNNLKVLENLRKLGFDINIEEVRELAGKKIVGRAHFAKLMTKKGYVSSVKEAFDLYLAQGKPGYCSDRLLSDKKAIRLIKNAGGKAFLAHLNRTGKSDSDTLEYIPYLKECGLDGLEGYYSEYTDEMHQKYMCMAERFGLSVSGGTDYHGSMKPHIEMGIGTGNMKIPYSVLENMR